MNDNENQELNTISLGNVENNNPVNVPVNDIPQTPIVPPVNPVEPVVPVSPIMPEVESLEPMDALSEAPVIPEPISETIISPVNPVNEANPINTPVAPVEPVAPQSTINYDIPQSLNEFSATPIFTDIGTVPPIINGPQVSNNLEPEKPKKKGGSKLLFTIIIILAIVAVGVGIYIFLNVTNKKVTLKYVQLEVGSEVSTKITDYAIFKNILSSTCSLDTSNITDTSVYGAEYTYKITCNSKVYTGKVKIVDTVKPEVTLKESVTVQINGDLNAEDFIVSCMDSTKCSYSFKDPVKVKEYLKTAESYKVPIIVKDEAGNEIEVTGTLIVGGNIADLYLICTKEMDGYTQVEQLGINDDTFNESDTRKYIFTLEDDAYQTFKTENNGKSVVTYQDITGEVKYNDTDKSIIITKLVTYQELNTEFNTTLPTTLSELRSFFVEQGYSWSQAFSLES